MLADSTEYIAEINKLAMKIQLMLPNDEAGAFAVLELVRQNLIDFYASAALPLAG